ncbi:hypothetical protein [Paractinoplanes toevensis]|nr:hypothetical protein [Actinoplanes toevensis]
MARTKHSLRRRLFRLTAAVVVGMGLVAGTAGPAIAAPQPPGAEEPTSGGFCTYHNWGGRFYCGTGRVWAMPNRLRELFVIGTDLSVWTRWETTNGSSGWVDLQGACLPAYTFVLRTYAASPAEMRLRCTGTDYRIWYKHRYSSGAWTGWNPE